MMASSPADDSNMAGIGGELDLALRKAAAHSESVWADVGVKPGVQVWRVEKFHLKPWPLQQYGQFHTGDSYIVLHTSQTRKGFGYEAYFWLGQESSIDEKAIAAYKTVELCDFLDGRPKQFREVQHEESRDFLALFSQGVEYLLGGISSGLRQVVIDGHEACLHRFSRTIKGVVQEEMELARSSLNHDNCFVLDIGRSIYIWFGAAAHPLERYEASRAAERIAASRQGQVTLMHTSGDHFWEVLDGCSSSQEAPRDPSPERPPSEEDTDDEEAPEEVTTVCAKRKREAPLRVPPEEDEQAQDESFDVCSLDSRSDCSVGSTRSGGSELSIESKSSSDSEEGILYKLSDDTGKLELNEVARGSMSNDMLDSGNVMILDIISEMCIWIGADASLLETRFAWSHAQKLLKSNSRDLDGVQIHMFKEGQKIKNRTWAEYFVN